MALVNPFSSIINNIGDEIKEVIQEFQDSLSKLLDFAKGAALDILDVATGAALDILDVATSEGNIFRARTANEVLVLVENITTLLEDDISKQISQLKPEMQDALVILRRAVTLLEDLPNVVLDVEDALAMDIRSLLASIPGLSTEPFYVREVRGINILKNPGSVYLVEIDGVGLGQPGGRLESSISLKLLPEGFQEIIVPIFNRPSDRTTQFQIQDTTIANLFAEKQINWLSAKFIINYSIQRGFFPFIRKTNKTYEVDIKLSLIPVYAGNLTVSYNIPIFGWQDIGPVTIQQSFGNQYFKPRYTASCSYIRNDPLPIKRFDPANIVASESFETKSDATSFLDNLRLTQLPPPLDRGCGNSISKSTSIPIGPPFGGSIPGPLQYTYTTRKIDENPKPPSTARYRLMIEHKVAGQNPPRIGSKRLSFISMQCVSGHCDSWYHELQAPVTSDNGTKIVGTVEVWSRAATWTMTLKVEEYKALGVTAEQPISLDVKYGELVEISLPNNAQNVRLNLDPLFGASDEFTPPNSDSNGLIIFSKLEPGQDSIPQVIVYDVKDVKN